ncbi:MAG: hypothetical protein P8Y64_05165 [Gammaproteobacteria bacterium]|jgi:uncharacterized membrane protein
MTAGYKVIKAESARSAAQWFHWGNIISVLIPFPLLIFWFGASMAVYVFTSHHPNPRVGFYVHRGAYLFYGLLCVLIPVGTYFPPKINYFIIYWIFTVALILPISGYYLYRIRYKEPWEDIEVPEDEPPLPPHD